VAALVTLDEAEIHGWAEERGLDGDMAALSTRPEVRDLIQAVVDDANRDRSRYEQVKRFVILPRDFTADAGEITPTLKLRRRAVLEHFEAQVDELYAP